MVAPKVSIHAPWEGCDIPRGADPAPIARFQFTHPGKGATQVYLQETDDNPFQFTHPGKGATYRFNPFRLLAYQFQFTHPGKGATSASAKFFSTWEVSIHAPWEGCDSLGLPCPYEAEVVSIHAPWEGCDYPAPVGYDIDASFNSRTLGRVRQ